MRMVKYAEGVGKKGAWKVRGRCVEGVWEVCEGGVREVRERCVEGVWEVCEGGVREVRERCVERVRGYGRMPYPPMGVLCR